MGYGEGCPREYVTGETVSSCVEFLNAYQDTIKADVSDLSSLTEWEQQHSRHINQSPSAFCAIEMAILDALGKQNRDSIETLLGIDSCDDPVVYTAVLGDSPYWTYRTLANAYVSRNFSDFKVKLSGNLRKDSKKLKFFEKQADPSYRVRLDANNLWHSAEESVRYLQQLPQVFWAIEEPVKARNFQALREVTQKLRVKVILDESCTSLEDLDDLEGDSWVCNLRISKLGGLLRSIKLADVAMSKGMGVSVGAHVGETSLLTRASIVLIHHLNNKQLATEGAFGTKLLKRDLTTKSLEFDEDAQLKLATCNVLSEPGLGLQVDDIVLKEVDHHPSNEPSDQKI